MSTPDPLIREAERGDLRPQFNPAALVLGDPARLKSLEPILLDRFFHLARPIGNASLPTDADLRLSDAGHFFYLVETLRRSRCTQLEEMLLVILDGFLEMTERSYDELYLWSIVELSRTDARHVDTFWPAAIALDLRFRQGWLRPAGVSIAEQPHRFCELLFHGYVLYTLHRKHAARPPLSVGRCMQRIASRLSHEETQLAGAVLLQLEHEQGRALYSDAYTMLMNPAVPAANHERSGKGTAEQD
jgi:hypothetical protein